MAIIQLTRGFETIVDDDLYEDLNSYKWYASGKDGRPARRLRLGPRKLIFLYHQVLRVLPWVLRQQGLEVDHDDYNPLNNQKYNLQVVTHKQNMRNTTYYGYRQGICLDNTHNKWKAYLDRPDEPRINIGTFLTEIEAQAALDQIKKEMGIEDN